MQDVLREGERTQTIYQHIQNHNYKKAYDELEKLQNHIHITDDQTQRCVKSVQAYCMYHSQDYAKAADLYGKLSEIFPNDEGFKAYHAQSLLKVGQFEPAYNIANGLSTGTKDTDIAHRATIVKVAAKYELNDMPGARQDGSKWSDDQEHKMILNGCVLFKNKQYEDAAWTFQHFLDLRGFEDHPMIVYNLAVCYYMQGKIPECLDMINRIIETGFKQHHNLVDPARSDPVPNSSILQSTALVEAFNLKFAIKYKLSQDPKNTTLADVNPSDILGEMPNRLEEDLDPVTLHNSAIAHIAEDPTNAFKKLNFLLNQPTFPPETIHNLITAYLQHGYGDLAADILAERGDFAYRFLTSESYNAFDVTILSHANIEEAFKKMYDLAEEKEKVCYRLKGELQQARDNRNSEVIADRQKALDEAVEILMRYVVGMAKAYWEREQYTEVGKTYKKYAEFCSDHKLWKLNMAHMYFVTGVHHADRYALCIPFYEQIVKQHNNILDVSAVVLGNLCVAYVMTSQNEEAEDVMRSVEREEEKVET